MRLPFLQLTKSKAQRQIIAFGGVNYSDSAGDGELMESYNLSSARYPFLSQRAGRKTHRRYDAPSGIYARGKLCVTDGTDLIYGGNVVGQVSEGEKQFATINTKIVIFPDKVFYDTESGEFGNLDAAYPCFAGDITFTSDKLAVRESSYIDRSSGETEVIGGVPDGTMIKTHSSASIDKDEGYITYLPLNGEMKDVDALSAGDVIYYGVDRLTSYQIVQSVDQQSDGTWQLSVIVHRSEYHEYTDFETVFKAGDAIDISGCTSCPDNNGSHIIRGVSGHTLTFDSDIFQQTGTEGGTVLLERKAPDLTCICQCDNRLWGAEGSTIYASALGDPTNFFVYDGTSMDSYAVAVGSEGEFTGCIAYSSAVLFFKEDCVHKVLGSYPAQYEIYTYRIPGVQRGCARSMVIINETLFYKGRNGVYAYTGGTPDLLTERFGTRRFYDAAAGTDGERYYISMADSKGVWHLFVFDTLRGVWLREDDTHAIGFAYLDGTLYYLDGRTNAVMMVGQDFSEEGLIDWSATLARIDETADGKKGYSRLYIRCELDAGSWLRIEVSEDGGSWRQVFATHNERARMFNIPILPGRCDSFAVRLSGRGTCMVRGISREFSLGSAY